MESGDYFTHYPVLAAALAAQPTGPVLEIGCGNWSTVMLHMMCGAQGRQLVTIEREPGWLARFEHLRRPWHRLQQVSDWDAFTEIDTVPWGVAFVDHSPIERRCIDIQRLRSHTQIIVIHDTQDGRLSCGGLLDTFRHRYDFKLAVPWTSVVSDLRSLPFDPVEEYAAPKLSTHAKVGLAAAAAGLAYLAWA